MTILPKTVFEKLVFPQTQGRLNVTAHQVNAWDHANTEGLASASFKITIHRNQL